MWILAASANFSAGKRASDVTSDLGFTFDWLRKLREIFQPFKANHKLRQITMSSLRTSSNHNLSTHIAIPMPPPIHSAATPLLPPVRFKPCNRVTRILHPDAPIGCPRAIAPPLTLTWKYIIKIIISHIDVSVDNKQLLDEVGRGWWHLLRPWLFRISQKRNLIIVLLYIVLKKITTNTPSQRTWIDIVIGNHALRAQPTD